MLKYLFRLLLVDTPITASKTSKSRMFQSPKLTEHCVLDLRDFKVSDQEHSLWGSLRPISTAVGRRPETGKPNDCWVYWWLYGALSIMRDKSCKVWLHTKNRGEKIPQPLGWSSKSILKHSPIERHAFRRQKMSLSYQFPNCPIWDTNGRFPKRPMVIGGLESTIDVSPLLENHKHFATLKTLKCSTTE